MPYEFLGTLSESKLIPTPQSLEKYRPQDLPDFLLLTLCALRVLLLYKRSNDNARDYVRKTRQWGSFDVWRQTGTDLYQLLHALEGRMSTKVHGANALHLDYGLVRNWLRDSQTGESRETTTRRLFLHLDRNLKIRDESLKAIRRLVMNWRQIDNHKRALAMTRLLQILRARMPRSELLHPLSELARHLHLELRGVDNPESLDGLAEGTKTPTGHDLDAYHGTQADFDAFDPERTGDIGLHFGTPEQASRAAASAFTGKYETGSAVMPVKLRLTNPLRVKDQFSVLGKTFINRAKTWVLATPGFRATDAERAEIYDAAKAADAARKRGGGDYSIKLDPSKAKHLAAYEAASKRFWKAIEASCIRQGYDGLVYDNKVEGKGDSYVVFKPEQVRSRFAKFDPEKADSPNLMDSADAEAKPPVAENASCGATSAASVATATSAIGGLGVGFNPNGDHGIYEPSRKKKKKSKVTVIKR
jgi:hypothetical protein